MSNFEDNQLQKSVVYLNEVETVAQDLLTAKQQKLELSNTKNKCNEAIRALEKSDERTSFVELGTSFLEFPKRVALELFKGDMETMNEEINKLQEDIKDKTSRLRDLEHQPGIVGVGLKPISGSEAKALQKAFGI